MSALGASLRGARRLAEGSVFSGMPAIGSPLAQLIVQVRGALQHRGPADSSAGWLALPHLGPVALVAVDRTYI